MDWQSFSTHVHAQRRFAEALLPIGTVEAHDGGPVGTDNLIPQALCERLAERLKMPRLPLMPFGVTQTLLAYPGACGISPETMERVLYELAVSLQHNGLERLFVIDGHGGNTEALKNAASRLFLDHRLHVAVIDWWWEVQPNAEEIFGKEGMGHAAVDEMGFLLGLYPDLRAQLPSGRVPSYYVYKGVKAYPSPRPTMTYDHANDPVDFARLTPEKCAQFAEVVVDRMEKIIRDIREGWMEIGQ